jgi:thiamine pyrophosphate-dependent acetolactate synthase large subunit-like protein
LASRRLPEARLRAAADIPRAKIYDRLSVTSSAFHLLSGTGPLPTGPWLARLADAEAQHSRVPERADGDGFCGPQAIAALAAQLPPGAVVTTGVGQHQMWTMQFLGPGRPRAAGEASPLSAELIG